MTIVVTGAAGFIGSNLVKALNDRGMRDIVAVDNLENAAKFRNLVDCEISDYVDKGDFRARLAAGAFGPIEAVLHQGACSDTMETDGRYMMENNYRYSVDLLDWCQQRKVPFIYASSAAVYGMGPVFREDPANERPLNVYGYSKFLFDQVVRRRLPNVTAPVVGLRYFNVYGPREAHKGRMASVAFHHFNQFRADGKVRLFEGQPRLCERRAAARLHPCRRRREGEPSFPRPRRLGRVQPRNGPRAAIQRRRARRREHDAGADEARRSSLFQTR